MFKKIILYCFALFPIAAFSSTKSSWINEINPEKNSYSYVSSVSPNNINKFEYKCSVVKTSDLSFVQFEMINIDLHLDLEEDRVQFQDQYDISIVFSNGRIFKEKLPIQVGTNQSDRFTFYLNRSNHYNESIINSLLYGNYVNVEVEDNNKKKLMFRFYLNGSNKSITESKNNCNKLFNTFK